MEEYVEGVVEGGVGVRSRRNSKRRKEKVGRQNTAP